jgi:hypothetical protein
MDDRCSLEACLGMLECHHKDRYWALVCTELALKRPMDYRMNLEMMMAMVRYE